MVKTPDRRTASFHPRRDRSPLVIAACRLPVHRTTGGGWAPSPGGLASALTPIAAEHGARWIGWTGEADDEVHDRVDGIEISGLAIPRTEIGSFYEQFSNAALWPLLHDGLRPSVLDASAWDGYCAVNDRFARTIAREAPMGATVWVHDYQLMLVPGLVHARRPDLRVAFFLHTPFPAPELLRRLPWHRELVDGLLGASLVGFQDEWSAEHFRLAAARFCGTHDHGDDLRTTGRVVRVRVHPIGVDAEGIEARAAAADSPAARAPWRALVGDRRLLLGVERLDYTKGIPERLLAYERLLEREPERRADTVFVQIAAPTRCTVAGYPELRVEVDAIAARIEARFGTPGQRLVHVLHRSLSFDEIVPLYRMADVMLVTPLKDGMNLVAKEFVATRADLGGALVLSEFAGAANQLTDAYLVNPYDVDGTADTLARVLTDDPVTKARRMAVLRRLVQFQDSHRWARRFLEDAAAIGTPALPGSTAAAGTGTRPRSAMPLRVGSSVVRKPVSS